MRRRAVFGLVLAGSTAGLVGLPTVTPAWARSRPVRPAVHRLPLRVDGTAAPGPYPPGVEPLLLTAPRGTAGFSVVGLTWQPDPAVRLSVQVRTRSGGRWSAWTALEPQSGHHPGGAEAAAAGLRDGTAPLWVGASDGVQVRVGSLAPVRPRDVRLELVDPGSSPADGAAPRPRASATALERRPAIVTRAQWGADESIRKGTPSYTSPPRVGFVHHTATSNARELGAGFVDPVVTGGTDHAVGSRGPVAVRAGTLRDLAWTGSVTDARGALLRTARGIGGEAVLSWDLTDARGAPVRPGSYELRLTGTAGGDTALPYVRTVVVSALECRGAPLQRALCRARLRRARR